MIREAARAKYRAIPARERRRLMRLARKGDTAALETLIRTDARLIMQAVRGVMKRGRVGDFGSEDVEQEAIIGYIRAVHHYDARRAAWSTYASRSMINYIHRSVDDRGHAIRLPVHRAATLRQFLFRAGTLHASGVEAETAAELAAGTEKRLRTLRHQPRVTNSLDEPLASTNGATVLGETIRVNRGDAFSPPRDVTASRLAEIIHRHLEPPLARALLLVTELEGQSKSNSEVGRRLGLSTATVTNQVRRAGALLRANPDALAEIQDALTEAGRIFSGAFTPEEITS